MTLKDRKLEEGMPEQEDQSGHRDKFGFTPLERGVESQKSVWCGMMDCAVPPEQVCRPCGMWYCTKDFPDHMAKYPEHAGGHPT